MNFIQLVNLLASAIGADYKNLSDSLTSVAGKQGDLTLLNTLEKTNLVGALNELKTGLTSVESTVVDSATIQGMIDAGITGVVDGAPDALNTLNEIASALAEDDTAIDGIMTALAKRVRVDQAQAFTTEEKAMGRSNIDAQDASEIGDVPNADFVATYNAAKVA